MLALKFMTSSGGPWVIFLVLMSPGIIAFVGVVYAKPLYWTCTGCETPQEVLFEVLNIELLVSVNFFL
jgi:hypothetical protein